MKKTGLALGIISFLLLLAMSGCKAETVTVTGSTTITKSTTVTQTVASTVTMISTVTSFISGTQASTTPSTTTPASVTISTSVGQVIAETEDGRLQVVSASLAKVTIAQYQVAGKVLNTSDEVLTARITVEFLTDGGEVDQTQYTLVADIQPGQQKSFTVSSIDTFNNCSDFSITIEVWD